MILIKTLTNKNYDYIMITLEGYPYKFVKLKARWIIFPRALEVLITPLPVFYFLSENGDMITRSIFTMS